MAWKQDLAKLKQQLEPEPLGPPKPAPKVVAKPTGPVVLDDEDAVFLSAMGLKPSAPKAPRPGPAAPPPEGGTAAPAPASPAPTAPPLPDTFQEAVRDLKGLKAMPKGLPELAARPVSPPLSKAPEVVPVPAPKPPDEPTLLEPVTLAPIPLVPPSMPVRFQLAAGMALEVDGTLDLRGHSITDAMERLKDRLGDGLVLGWRSLQVTLGTDPSLHEGLLALLASGEAPMVSRYAQAPVPMGGSQAWLLYFAAPSSLS